MILLLALAPLGVLAWVGITVAAGWWPLIIAAYLLCLLIAWVASVGGIAEVWRRWMERRRPW